VANACGALTNCATLTVASLTTVAGPTSVTNCVGTTATFTAAASGTGPFSYQWTKNGTAILGATSSVYSLVVTGPGDTGTYCVVVAGFCNSLTNCATLELCPTNTIAQKWLQIPDTSTNGLDVNAMTLYPYKILADDFLCTATGPITQIRIWASWLNDNVPTPTNSLGPPCFCLGLWSDVPRSATNAISHPGVQLCNWCFTPADGNMTNFVYASGVREGFFDPNTGAIIGNDTVIWEYVFNLPTNNSCWWQTNGTSTGCRSRRIALTPTCSVSVGRPARPTGMMMPSLAIRQICNLRRRSGRNCSARRTSPTASTSPSRSSPHQPLPARRHPHLQQQPPRRVR